MIDAFSSFILCVDMWVQAHIVLFGLGSLRAHYSPKTQNPSDMLAFTSQNDAFLFTFIGNHSDAIFRLVGRCNNKIIK